LKKKLAIWIPIRVTNADTGAKFNADPDPKQWRILPPPFVNHQQTAMMKLLGTG
jgi:hypothetical protein